MVIADGIATWIGSLATAGAVAVALAGYWLGARREGRRRPRLALEFDRENSRIEEAHAQVAGPTGSFARLVYHELFVRLGISNAEGCDAAQRAQVLVLDVVSQVGATTSVVTFGAPPLGWTNVAESEVTVGAGITRLADFLRMVPKEMGSGDMGRLALVLASAPPNDSRHVLAPGTHVIRLAVTAHNADAVNYTASVHYDGKWGDHEPDPWKHISVSALPASRDRQRWRTVTRRNRLGRGRR